MSGAASHEVCTTRARPFTASGRSIETADLDDQSVDRLFERIEAEQGRLDVLVNNAWGGYERMVEDGRFT